MGMEGIGYSDLLRNSTEEVLISNLMDSPIGKVEPSLEIFGFKSIMPSLKAENEEPFDSWLVNGEFSASPFAVRTRHAPMRMPTDHCSSQQIASEFQKKSIMEHTSLQNFSSREDHACGSKEYSQRNSADDVIPDSNFYSKGWFQSTQPWSKSMASEPRRYACAQDSQVPMVSHEPHTIHGQGTDCMKQDFRQMSNFCNVTMGEMPNQLHTFMSASNSPAPFDTSMTTSSTFGSVLSLLMGTLDHKNLHSKVGRHTYGACSFDMLNSQEVGSSAGSIQGLGKKDSVFHMFSPMEVPDNGNIATIRKSFKLNFEGVPTKTKANHMQTGALSREHSRSESSMAEPAFSGGFEVCDGPDQSGHAFPSCVNSQKHGRDDATQNETKNKGICERVFESGFNCSRKKESLAQMDSLASGASGDSEDPTKKRRIERSRKLAEAKERSSTLSLPSDMQAALKRCDDLEKEIRSLKLNLSFMNRKDSEQSKQIEDLLKRNEELTDEKELLLEERARIISVSGKS